MTKLILLGLDGATFEMLDPMMETGRLPVLKRLLCSGARGVMESTVPPVTCPAWPTMYTGKNPGAHGFTSFRRLEPGRLAYRATTLQDVQAARLWSVLNGAGIRTGIFNVPATYPAEAVEGFMLSGFVTPPQAPEVLQPAELRDEFARAFPKYDANVIHEGALFNRKSKRRRLIERVGETLETRLAALEWLLERQPVDFLWVVLETIDRLSHYGYAFLSPQSDLYGTPAGRDVREWTLAVLEKQDEGIGRMLERMGCDTVVIVVSDHGFAWTPRLFDLHGWLVSEGLLVRRKGLRLGRRIKSAVRSSAAKVLGQAVWVRASHRRSRRLQARGQLLIQGQTWDWGKTKTWLGATIEYGVRINSRQYHDGAVVVPDAYDGVRQAVLEGLAAVADPATGEPVFDWVRRREDVYSGSFVDRAPDVFLLPKRHIMHDVSPLHSDGASAGWLVPAPDVVSQAHHDSFGIFAGVGEPFRATEATGMTLLDVMPTVLYTMGLPVPEDSEGRVVEEAFAESYRSSHPVRRAEYAGTVEPTQEAVSTYSAEDEATISKRLEELGYL